MKNLFLFLSAGLIFGFVFFASCGGNGNGGEDLTPQQEQARALQGTWAVQSATVPQGVDPAILDGGTITFNTDQSYNPGSFGSSGMPDFFSTSGSSSWAFSGTSTSLVVFSNVSPVTGITVNNVSGNSLSISFSHPGLAGGRVTDLSGAYTAQLSK
jgi:hypothetical protein